MLSAAGNWPIDSTRVDKCPDKCLYSVRSREGRRNRAPPPRVRFNKDGKKINPQQAAAKTTQA